VTGIRSRLSAALVLASLVTACGKGQPIEGTYVEVEAFGTPTTLELRADGSGGFIVNIGGRSVEDPFSWSAAPDGDTVLLVYPSGATESFAFEGDELVFTSDGDTVRYARSDADALVPVESSDIPFSILQ